MRITIFVLVVLFGLAATAQPLSPEEAQAKLAEKNAHRQAERAQTVQITAGELADLKMRIKQLEGEVAALKGKAADPPKKLPMMIEIGMTKADVLAFVKRTKSLQIVGMSADAGVSRSVAKIAIKDSTTVKIDETVAKNSQTPDNTKTNTDTTGTAKREIETTSIVGVQETIQIQRNETYQEQVLVGTHVAVGGGPTEYEYGNATRSRPVGLISVHLVDGIVTSVDAK